MRGFFSASGVLEMQTILIIDESPAQIRDLAERIEHWGYDTLAASSTVEGIEVARTLGPDLILLDQCLLETTGLEALSVLCRDPLTRDIPVIMLSSRPHPAAKIRALWHGARDYLSKPVDAAALSDALDVALDYPVRTPSLAV